MQENRLRRDKANGLSDGSIRVCLLCWPCLLSYSFMDALLLHFHIHSRRCCCSEQFPDAGFPGALQREVPGWHLTHNRTVGGLCVRDSSFHITFRTWAMISTRTEMLRVIFINEEVKGPTHRLPSPRHHGIGLTHYRWSPVCLLGRLSIKPAYPWGPAAVRPSYVARYTQAHVHKHRTERLRSCVSSRGHTAHQTALAFVTLHATTAAPQWGEG